MPSYSKNITGLNKNSAPHVRSSIARIGTESVRRNYSISANQDVQATTHVVNGNSLIVGTGEVLIDVRFPVAFIKAPSVTTGGELSAESIAVPGQFPTLSAVVNQWYIEDPDLDLYGGSLRRYYRGAVMACVVTGPGTQKMLLHWTFSGMALTNPGAGTFEVPPANSTGRSLG